jgi:hypothetical protein
MRRRPSTAASGLAGKKRARKKKAALSGENERTAERLRRG